MRTGSSRTSAQVALVLFVLISPLLVFAQTGASTWTPPRTPWGDPDLQGVWPGTAMMGVPMERPRQLGNRRFLTDEEFAARQNPALAQPVAAPRAPAQGRTRDRAYTSARSAPSARYPRSRTRTHPS